MATKFAHLLQTHHPTAYIGLFTDPARAALDATIQMLRHSAHITSNAQARNATLNPVSHQIGQQARAPKPALRNSSSSAQFTSPRVPCSWCGGPHPLTECYSRDWTNVQRYPNPTWPGGVPPLYVETKYAKNLPKNPNANSTRKLRWASPSTSGLS
jgi:hypothetical protein